MINYLLKIWVMLMFSALIIFFYYSNRAHIENFDGYFIYIIFVSIFYGVYKYLQLNSIKDKVIFTPLKIFGYFFVHLALLSVLFFYYNGNSFGDAFGYGIGLSFKILFYSIFPILIVLITTSFGQLVLNKIGGIYKEKTEKYKFITGIGFGIFLFIFVLTILGMLGFYNLYSVFSILIIFGIFSYRNILNLLIGILNYKIKFKGHNLYSNKLLEKINPKLLSTEFLFIVITLLLSVNLISIFRPFPIGWDDLGAYMNYAHLMASDGSVGFLGSMMSWQTFTGIGYMFGNPTLAFFLNNIGGFVSVIVIALIVSEIFKNKKETFINLPLLASTIFISMPMVVFQQAKDMKLDAGLFFISIIALYMLFEFYNGYKKIELSKKEILKLFGIIGLLLGFAFTIKFTTLLLISAIIGVLFFTRLGLLGFLGYLSIYFAIFTVGSLWKMMNVVIPTNYDFKIQFGFAGFIIGIILLIVARIKNKKRFRRFIPRIIALFIGIIIAVAPWGINNINQAGKIGISEIISGKSEHFIADYNKIYSKKELEKIKEKSEISAVNSSGTTTNEDFGRYFGYEKGINNYIKLPWNLTMQKNQGGEFTDIGFLFLALLPSLLLFLPFTRREYSLGVYLLLLGEILIFIIPQTRELITTFFAGFSMPFGYILILLLFLLPLVFLIPTVQKQDLSKLFKINLVFTIFYTFLWSISAFGIVWYGIVMYFNFILMIIFGAYYLGSYDNDDSNKDKQIRFFGSLVFFTIICVYIFMSIFPHTFKNLKNAGYGDYKKGKITITDAPFLFHEEYLPILFDLNIKDEKKEEFISKSLEGNEIKNIFKKYNVGSNINIAKEILEQIIKGNKFPMNIRKDANNTLNNLYSGILDPKNKYKNDVGIYRIGTFLKYYISGNNKRLYEDSLLNNFEKYFYSKNINTTVNKMKKIGLGYLLVDLNAATIDRDPRHDLTKRYEKLMTTFTSDKLELIDTDSICLKIGLENYKKEKDLRIYKILAGVNYDGYDKNGKRISRKKKQLTCYKAVITLFNAKQVNKDNYNYLLKFKPYLDKLKNQNEKLLFLSQHINHGYKVLFKIK